MNRIANLERCIVHAATECEACMRLADFADREPNLSTGMADSLRKLAAYHSANAFFWACELQPLRAAA